MTSAYVPEDQPTDLMSPRERLLRIVAVLLVAAGLAAMLMW